MTSPTTRTLRRSSADRLVRTLSVVALLILLLWPVRVLK
jgi:hypothetical protein